MQAEREKELGPRNKDASGEWVEGGGRGGGNRIAGAQVAKIGGGGLRLAGKRRGERLYGDLHGHKQSIESSTRQPGLLATRHYRVSGPVSVPPVSRASSSGLLP